MNDILNDKRAYILVYRKRKTLLSEQSTSAVTAKAEVERVSQDKKSNMLFILDF